MTARIAEIFMRLAPWHDFANSERVQSMIEELDRFTGRGTMRATFSAEFRRGSDYLRDKMQEAGLTVPEDAVGNLFGRMEARDPALAPIIVGSHFDSVPCGGKFDGPAGVISGIETAFLFQEHGLSPERPIDVIAMIKEEGARFGSGLMASRLMTGKLATEGLSQVRDKSGISFDDALRGYGLDPALAGGRVADGIGSCVSRTTCRTGSDAGSEW